MTRKVNNVIVAGNWKMNGDAQLVEKMLARFDHSITNVDVVVFPPFTLLERVESDDLKLGAQNVSAHSSGAYTGEISPQMLIDAGCSYTLVGHSERRQQHAECGELMFAKVDGAIASGLSVIYCIGESETARDNGSLFEVLSAQLDDVFGQLSEQQMAKVSVAYEPIWAIGTGRAATPEQVQEVHAFIRNYVCAMNTDIGNLMPLLYGGSVNAGNPASLFELADVNGALVGGASLDADKFVDIIKSVNL